MFVELNCGQCASSLSLEADDETAVWIITNRFANAHTSCGFVAPSQMSDSEGSFTKKMVWPRIIAETEEP